MIYWLCLTCCTAARLWSWALLICCCSISCWKYWAALGCLCNACSAWKHTQEYRQLHFPQFKTQIGTDMNNLFKLHINLAVSEVRSGFVTHLHSLSFIQRHLSYLRGAGVSPWCCTAIGWAGVGLVFSCLHAHWMDDQSIKLCNRIPEKNMHQKTIFNRGLMLIGFIKY